MVIIVEILDVSLSAERVSIREDRVGAAVGAAVGVLIGLYFIRQGLKWRKVPEQKRTALQLSPLAGRFHRHPTFSIIIGVIGVALFGSVMIASIYFAVSRS